MIVIGVDRKAVSQHAAETLWGVDRVIDLPADEADSKRVEECLSVVKLHCSEEGTEGQDGVATACLDLSG
jgi:hypothetical protein